MDVAAVEASKYTHLRFKEVRWDKNVILDRTEMPWLTRTDEVTVVPLALVTRVDGSQFYLGSAIRGELIRMAGLVSEDDSRRANKMFYAAAEKVAEGNTRMIDQIDHPTSCRPIAYVGNKNGIRVYFMLGEEIEHKPVIIRIAVCHSKGQEEAIYRFISSDCAKTVHQRLYR